jgi:hypothetical protein
MEARMSDTKYYGADDDAAAIERKMMGLQRHYEAKLEAQYKSNASLSSQRDAAGKETAAMQARAIAAEAIIQKLANPLLIDFSKLREEAAAYLRQFPERLKNPIEGKGQFGENVTVIAPDENPWT